MTTICDTLNKLCEQYFAADKAYYDKKSIHKAQLHCNELEEHKLFTARENIEKQIITIVHKGVTIETDKYIVKNVIIHHQYNPYYIEVKKK